jgi:hypothetical protein
MTSIHLWQQFNKRILVLAATCLALVLLHFFSPAQVLAREVTSGPTFRVNAGFEAHYRDGNWVPVIVTLHNDGPDFSGTVSLITPTTQFLGNTTQGIPSNYQVSITLANGAQKQVTLYVPLYFDVQNVTVKLLDSSGSVVGSQNATLTPLLPGDILIGILSDQSSGFNPLGTVSLPNQGGSINLVFLNASTLPVMAAALKNFNAILLDNFTISNLSPTQLSALQTWVNQGGTLILVGGPEWHRTLGALPAGLLPVKVNGSATLAAGTSLLPTGGPQTLHLGQNHVRDSVQAPITISTTEAIAQGDPGKTAVILASPTAPLIVQAHQEQGTIIYLAFDPTLEPVLGWQGASILWEGLLLRSLGDQLLTHSGSSPGIGSSTQQPQPLLASRMSGFLQSLLPTTIPPPWQTLALLLAGYIIMLGPVRFLLVNRLKRRDWSWRIILSSIVIFSLLSYGLAYIEKGTSILSDSITIAQLNQNGSSAHTTTYLGVFVPNEGDYQVHIPGIGLAQPSPDNFTSSLNGPSGQTAGSHISIAQVRDGTDVNLQDVNIWTLHTVLAEQDRPIHKGLTSQLTIQNGSLEGTVTNTLGYALSDAFLLMPNDALSLGHMAAGQSKRVQLKLSSTPIGPNVTLADQIALNTGSPPYQSMPDSLPLTAWQRHLSILYALDGEGFFNYSYVCTVQCNVPVNPLIPILQAQPGINPITIGSSTAYNNSVNILATPSWQYTATTNNDPLLVPGTPATLIGWTTNSLDSTNNVTVNNITPAGLHETLIQAPLSVNVAGPLGLPPNFIEGHLINVEGSNAQLMFPDVYTISTGSMTFEYIVPNTGNFRANSLIISEPPDLNLVAQGTPTPNAGSLPFRLYNWHTHTWDAISLNQSAFTTNNVSAYIGSGGRVLVQLNNKDSSLGTFLFGKPLINLQGVFSDNPSGNR